MLWLTVQVTHNTYVHVRLRVRSYQALLLVRSYQALLKGRKVSNRMCLFGETLNVWCSMASAAVVSATVVGATAVDAADVHVGVTSGVLYGVVVVQQWSVGVMGGVLYGAAIVQQWFTWHNSMCAATVGAAAVDVTCAFGGASNRAWLSVGTLDGGLSCRATHSPMNACCVTTSFSHSWWELHSTLGSLLTTRARLGAPTLRTSGYHWASCLG